MYHDLCLIGSVFLANSSLTITFAKGTNYLVSFKYSTDRAVLTKFRGELDRIQLFNSGTLACHLDFKKASSGAKTLI